MNKEIKSFNIRVYALIIKQDSILVSREFIFGKYVYKLNEIFEECKDFLGKDFGCISFYDDSRSHLLFTSIKKNNSITFEHGF